mmetsp:Transcript_10316/g.21946  ORF Transcript_10316/g.21946 Transcript_10316/m.21946 type:complete len:200 (-) Transcript_10316:347-946(-)
MGADMRRIGVACSNVRAVSSCCSLYRRDFLATSARHLKANDAAPSGTRGEGAGEAAVDSTRGEGIGLFFSMLLNTLAAAERWTTSRCFCRSVFFCTPIALQTTSVGSNSSRSIILSLFKSHLAKIKSTSSSSALEPGTASLSSESNSFLFSLPLLSLSCLRKIASMYSCSRMCALYCFNTILMFPRSTPLFASPFKCIE